MSAEFRALQPAFREVISDTCQRMGSGMLVYYLQSPDSLEQWDEVGRMISYLAELSSSRDL